MTTIFKLSICFGEIIELKIIAQKILSIKLVEIKKKLPAFYDSPPEKNGNLFERKVCSQIY